jgi:uncharacterized OsmC-like protein
MGTNRTGLVAQRQGPLRDRYARVPAEARIFDGAQTLNACKGDAFHGSVVPANASGMPLRFGIHRAIGGDHDLPNPGDLLCSALAACLDSSLRMLADHLGVRLASLQVTVTAECDVRGCLLVERGVPVGFQRMRCSVRLQPEAGVEDGAMQMLLAAAENSCVVLQTLRNGVPVTCEVEAGEGASEGATASAVPH